MSEQADVIVIGAGLAGLAAARELQASHRRVLVLEASDRVGGRTRSASIGDEQMDCGGEWTGAFHSRVLALAREFSLHLEPARLFPYTAYWRGSEGTRLGRLPRLSARDELAFARMLWRAKRLARVLDPHHPWNSPAAERFDSVSVAAWFTEMRLRGDARTFLGSFISALASAPIERMSLLHLLWWIRRGGGPLAMLYKSFQYRVLEGAEAISRSMAAQLEVRLDAPIRHIDQTPSGVGVATAAGEHFSAPRAIVAIPCSAMSGIEFAPALPPALQELTQISNEPATKVAALLPPAHTVRPHFVTAGGNLAGAWRYGRRINGFAAPPHDQLPDETLIAELASAFQVPNADLQEATIYRWREHPYIPGCDIAFAPGELTRLGAHLQTAHGRVHFAGAERSSWPNNMEGALESGQSAAQAILR